MYLEDVALLAIEPPTPPPIAAASTITMTTAKIIQNVLLFKPNIRRCGRRE